jgi:hypothetical protein
MTFTFKITFGEPRIKADGASLTSQHDSILRTTFSCDGNGQDGVHCVYSNNPEPHHEDSPIQGGFTDGHYIIEGHW